MPNDNLIRTYSGRKLSPAIMPNLARTQAIKLIPSATYLQGTILGEVTATPGVYKAYVAGAGDGSGVPKCILEYDTTTDALGKHYLASSAVSEYGQGLVTTSAYIKGTFRSQELVQAGPGAIDAAAVGVLGRILEGSITVGLISII